MAAMRPAVSAAAALAALAAAPRIVAAAPALAAASPALAAASPALAASASPALAAAPAPSDPPVGLAIGTGASLAIAPLIAGGVLFASTDDDALRRAGVYVLMAGLVAAPLASHLVVREWKRAALFAALPLAALVCNAVLFAATPDVTTFGSATTRTLFGVALTAGVLGATVGLADTFGAADRARARRGRLLVAPTLGTRGGGLLVGATF